MRDDALLKLKADFASPETLLAAILDRHPDWTAPVPVEAFARSVGIIDIQNRDGDGFVSALIADGDGKEGTILCTPGLSVQRRRFAIAHELGHFLIGSQRRSRQCTARDLGESRRDTPQRKDEMQANRFAAGLLMPKPWFRVFVDGLGKPTVAHLPLIAAQYDVSLETAASRYADLTAATCAFIFVKNGVIRYARPSRTFPALAIKPGDPVAPAVRSAAPGDRIAWAEADVRDWLVVHRDTRPPKLTMQIASKANGFQLVMLFINAAAERRADEETDKAATEWTTFGRRPRGT